MSHPVPRRWLRRGALPLLLLGLAAAAPGTVRRVERISVASAGRESSGGVRNPSISADGRFVAFYSDAYDLVPDHYGGVFVRDRATGVIESASVTSSGAPSSGVSPVISADGRYIAFLSKATNLPLKGSLTTNVFVHDRMRRTTECVSVSREGTRANDHCSRPDISADGRYVAFVSAATNLVTGTQSGIANIFVRDRLSNTTEQVTRAFDQTQPSGASNECALSADGRYVALVSAADNLIEEDSNFTTDVYVHDRATGATERVSMAVNGGQSTGPVAAPSISADGRYVAFESLANNLVLGDTNEGSDVFVRDRLMKTTERVSVASDGREVDHLGAFRDYFGNPGILQPKISANGRYVVFDSRARNVTPGDAPPDLLVPNVFVRDRMAGITARVSRTANGGEPNLDSYQPCISADGRHIAYLSFARDLIPGDENVASDIFVWDRDRVVTERVNLPADNRQGNDLSDTPSLSGDGRFVAFRSRASGFDDWPLDPRPKLFIRDRKTQSTESVSLATDGTRANAGCDNPSVSADGRQVAFASDANNLVSGDTNGVTDVFLRDRLAPRTERMSVSSMGAQGNGASLLPALSADARFLAFISEADNLVSGDTNGLPDVFVRDRATGVTERVNLSSEGAQANARTMLSPIAISANGRYVAFASRADNLVPGDTNKVPDIFVRDRTTRTTRRVSVSSEGVQGNGESAAPSISADGRLIAFRSGADNLIPTDRNRAFDIFVHDRSTGITECVSVAYGGGEPDGECDTPVIATEGRAVAFVSEATNLVPGDNNQAPDVFVFDRVTGVTERVSVDTSGNEANGISSTPALSGDGRTVAFTSEADNLVGGDTNAVSDVFTAEIELAVPTLPRSRIAVFRPSSREWFLRGTDGSATIVPFGGPGDLPYPADYLGTGTDQIAVYRPSTREWFIRTDDGRSNPIRFGALGDMPVPADYLTLGRAQIAVFRPATAEWILRGEAGDAVGPIPFGATHDRPVPADYLGRGHAQIAVFRAADGPTERSGEGAWWLIRGDASTTLAPIPFGQPDDVPVPGDYLGLGYAQIAVFRPATAEWRIRGNDGTVTVIPFGTSGDLPVPAGYSGEGKTQIAVYRPSTGQWLVREESGAATLTPWGGPGDRPVPARFPLRLSTR